MSCTNFYKGCSKRMLSCMLPRCRKSCSCKTSAGGERSLGGDGAQKRVFIFDMESEKKTISAGKKRCGEEHTKDALAIREKLTM